MNLVAIGRALRRGWIWVALILVAAVAGGWIATSLMPVQYTSQTRLLYSLPATGSLQDQLQAANLSAQRAATDAQLVVTPSILGPIADTLGNPEVTTNVLVRDVTSLAQATLLEVTVTLPTAADAAAVASGIVTQLQDRAAADEITTNPLDPEAPTYSFVVTPVVPAVIPDQPSSPNVLINMLIALAVGLVAAAAFLALRASADDRIYDADDMSALTDIPVMGSIAPTLADGGTASSTASLRTALLSRDPRRGRWLIAPAGRTGAQGAGRALAASLAAIGYRPLLLVTDGRNTEKGLTDYLTDDATVEEIVDTTSIAGVRLVPAGTAGDRGADILARKTTPSRMEALAEDTDLIVITSPPADSSAEAAILSRPHGGTLVLVRRGSTTKGQLERALGALHEAGADIVGLVWLVKR